MHNQDEDLSRTKKTIQRNSLAAQLRPSESVPFLENVSDRVQCAVVLHKDGVFRSFLSFRRNFWKRLYVV